MRGAADVEGHGSETDHHRPGMYQVIWLLANGSSQSGGLTVLHHEDFLAITLRYIAKRRELVVFSR